MRSDPCKFKKDLHIMLMCNSWNITIELIDSCLQYRYIKEYVFNLLGVIFAICVLCTNYLNISCCLKLE